jgi:hypothetical protein
MIPIPVAIQIFTNPRDLRFVIVPKEENRCFELVVFRGPGGGNANLANFEFSAATDHELLEMVKAALLSVYESNAPRFADLSEREKLTPDLIDWIMKMLGEHGTANTYKA